MLIINPFNLVYFGYLALNVLLIVVITLLFKNKSEKTKSIVILSISLFNIIFWIAYKIVLWIGNKDLASTGFQFNIWRELPFQLCNISLILVPVGLLLNKKTFYAYGFYVGVLGAFMAVTFPCLGFCNTSILGLHNIGFYGTHGIIMVVGILLVTLGFLKPSFEDIPSLVILLIMLSIFAYDLNHIIFELTHTKANYFYVIEPEGISILELFWKILPIEFFYLVFGVLVLIIYALIINVSFLISKKIKEKTNE